jgi:hypothetical protein
MFAGLLGIAAHAEVTFGLRVVKFLSPNRTPSQTVVCFAFICILGVPAEVTRRVAAHEIVIMHVVSSEEGSDAPSTFSNTRFHAFMTARQPREPSQGHMRLR